MIDPHSIGWGRAMASLWGDAADRDLDEAVRLSEEAPIRLRYHPSEPNRIIRDRDLELKTVLAGTHVMIRFYFKSGKYFEQDIVGIVTVDALTKRVDIQQ